jgi:UDP-N-acetylglucosamine--N-acetylmuramyl-(pentapeptide) pyrophosphoryl-undecaprenol N-acetylglucosamine transferase
MGIPTILHEQNAVLGKANIWLADKAIEIATSLPDTKGIKESNRAKVTTTGNPVRAAVVAARDSVYAPPGEDMRILITGGSQAAKVFSDVVPEAVGKLPEDVRRRLTIVHQCREDMIEVTARKYEAAGVKAEIKSFFNDIADRLKNCHLFIGRSGASTVAEVAVVGRPAVFVPYPGHSDMQQKHNADVVAGRGGGWVFMQEDFTPEALAAHLGGLARDPATLEKAAAAAKSCGHPEASRNLADVVEKRLKAPQP